ncbi:hypothetical protein [Solirubrobacter soli]|uniref:hypothetical protein n=1 Tax=Solirubrobacter soli TaxID=363832 RepID=UPI0003F703CD|nr:hypothetical protein [Solirubrobacter soli]
MDLIVGTEDETPDWWQATLSELAAFLERHAGRLAYGRVWRGRSPGETLRVQGMVGADWPDRRSKHRGRGFSKEAFEAVLAPDAFGVQLLGPGYAGRVPVGPRWRGRPAGENAVLLEHVDPAAWFAAPFETQWTHWGPGKPVPPEVPVPAVLAEARADLASILEGPGAWARAGFPALERDG